MEDPVQITALSPPYPHAWRVVPSPKDATSANGHLDVLATDVDEVAGAALSLVECRGRSCRHLLVVQR
jgi:hypothetical protein